MKVSGPTIMRLSSVSQVACSDHGATAVVYRVQWYESHGDEVILRTEYWKEKVPNMFVVT